MRLLEKLIDVSERLDRLPALLRYPAFGAAFIWLLIGMKGGFVGIPIVFVLIALTSQTPGADLLRVGQLFGLVTVGGAFAGLSYGVLGRWLRPLPLGPYIAGLVTTAPYCAVLVLAIRIVDRHPVLAPLTAPDLAVAAICTLLFGPLLGHWFLRDL